MRTQVTTQVVHRNITCLQQRLDCRSAFSGIEKFEALRSLKQGQEGCTSLTICICAPRDGKAPAQCSGKKCR